MTLSTEQQAERNAAIAILDYKEGVVTEIDGRSVSWREGVTDGWGISWREGFDPPSVGDTVRFYGKFGQPVRGVDVNGEPVWFKTQREMNQDHEEFKVKLRQQRQEQFEEGQTKLDEQYEKLPEVFRDRIDKFRRTRADWRAEHEGYEMSACVDAVHIAQAAPENPLDHDEWFTEFANLPWDKQKEMIPELFDGHSGNSFGFAVRLAWYYLTDPKMVVFEHGALTPLNGCQNYGCPHPPPQDLLKKYGIDTTNIEVSDA